MRALKGLYRERRLCQAQNFETFDHAEVASLDSCDNRHRTANHSLERECAKQKEHCGEAASGLRTMLKCGNDAFLREKKRLTNNAFSRLSKFDKSCTSLSKLPVQTERQSNGTLRVCSSEPFIIEHIDCNGPRRTFRPRTELGARAPEKVYVFLIPEDDSSTFAIVQHGKKAPIDTGHHTATSPSVAEVQKKAEECACKETLGGEIKKLLTDPEARGLLLSAITELAKLWDKFFGTKEEKETEEEKENAEEVIEEAEVRSSAAADEEKEETDDKKKKKKKKKSTSALSAAAASGGPSSGPSGPSKTPQQKLNDRINAYFKIVAYSSLDYRDFSLKAISDTEIQITDKASPEHVSSIIVSGLNGTMIDADLDTHFLPSLNTLATRAYHLSQARNSVKNIDGYIKEINALITTHGGDAVLKRKLEAFLLAARNAKTEAEKQIGIGKAATTIKDTEGAANLAIAQENPAEQARNDALKEVSGKGMAAEVKKVEDEVKLAKKAWNNLKALTTTDAEVQKVLDVQEPLAKAAYEAADGHLTAAKGKTVLADVTKELGVAKTEREKAEKAFGTAKEAVDKGVMAAEVKKVEDEVKLAKKAWDNLKALTTTDAEVQKVLDAQEPLAKAAYEAADGHLTAAKGKTVLADVTKELGVAKTEREKAEKAFGTAKEAVDKGVMAAEVKKVEDEVKLAKKAWDNLKALTTTDAEVQKVLDAQEPLAKAAYEAADGHLTAAKGKTVLADVTKELGVAKTEREKAEKAFGTAKEAVDKGVMAAEVKKVEDEVKLAKKAWDNLKALTTTDAEVQKVLDAQEPLAKAAYEAADGHLTAAKGKTVLADVTKELGVAKTEREKAEKAFGTAKEAVDKGVMAAEVKKVEDAKGEIDGVITKIGQLIKDNPTLKTALDPKLAIATKAQTDIGTPVADAKKAETDKDLAAAKKAATDVVPILKSATDALAEAEEIVITTLTKSIKTDLEIFGFTVESIEEKDEAVRFVTNSNFNGKALNIKQVTDLFEVKISPSDGKMGLLCKKDNLHKAVKLLEQMKDIKKQIDRIEGSLKKLGIEKDGNVTLGTDTIKFSTKQALSTDLVRKLNGAGASAVGPDPKNIKGFICKVNKLENIANTIEKEAKLEEAEHAKGIESITKSLQAFDISVTSIKQTGDIITVRTKEDINLGGLVIEEKGLFTDIDNTNFSFKKEKYAEVINHLETLAQKKNTEDIAATLTKLGSINTDHGIDAKTKTITFSSDVPLLNELTEAIKNIDGVTVKETSITMPLGSLQAFKEAIQDVTLSPETMGKYADSIQRSLDVLLGTKKGTLKQGDDYYAVFLEKGHDWDQEVLKGLPDDVEVNEKAKVMTIQKKDIPTVAHTLAYKAREQQIYALPNSLKTIGLQVSIDDVDYEKQIVTLKSADAIPENIKTKLPKNVTIEKGAKGTEHVITVPFSDLADTLSALEEVSKEISEKRKEDLEEWAKNALERDPVISNLEGTTTASFDAKTKKMNITYKEGDTILASVDIKDTDSIKEQDDMDAQILGISLSLVDGIHEAKNKEKIRTIVPEKPLYNEGGNKVEAVMNEGSGKVDLTFNGTKIAEAEINGQSIVLTLGELKITEAAKNADSQTLDTMLRALLSGKNSTSGTGILEWSALSKSGVLNRLSRSK